MLHLSSVRTISICSELWNQIVLPTFLFSIDIFYEYDTRNQHSHITHAPSPSPSNSLCANSERHSYVPCDQTQPRPSESRPAATILLWSKIKCGYKNLLLSKNISKKTVISKLIALALLAVHLPQIRTFTELQTSDNQDSRQHNISLDIVHEIFVKTTLLSNSHSESFYLF